MAPPSSSSSSSTLSVRIIDASGSSAYDTLRVFVHPATLRAQQMQAATPAAILLSTGTSSACFVADVWPRSTLEVGEICVPEAYLSDHATPLFYHATLHNIDSAAATGCGTNLPRARHITLTCVEPNVETDAEARAMMAAMAKEYLLRRKYVAPDMLIGLDWPRGARQVRVRSVEGHPGASALNAQKDTPSNVQEQLQKTYATSRSMQVTMDQQQNVTSATTGLQMNNVLQKESAYATLGGLDAQIEEVRKLVELPLRRPDIFRRYGLRAPRGLLLFGPPGTGKTTLAYSAAKACVPATSIETISGPELSSSLHGGTERALRKVFQRARLNAPSVVIIDEIDALAPRRDGDVDGAGEVEKRVVATLLTLMDGLGADGDEEARVVVIAATNRPNALDPALRRPGRLDREIEVGIPTSDARLSILVVLLRGVPHALSRAQIKAVADRTHGYVGADLSALVREAGMRALARDMERGEGSDALSKELAGMSLTSGHAPEGLSAEDFAVAQAKVRPSAMREISLEMPKVAWSDIAPGQGGLEVQRRIRECVEWPLKHGETMRRLGIDAPRGVLLYGPPGCSKTLIARALASESGLNFVAVKGPELLNKYVGESERALREVFRKARAASPSIVFFDEIDGLMTSRGTDEGSGGDRLITTLLNEMDGVEQLTNVLVVAATNRPEVLDGALLRPGRLDRLLYVGPPDVEARHQILVTRTRSMELDEHVDLQEIAQLTEGCSGAEVVYVCQDAGLRAMNEDINASNVRQVHFQQAAQQVRRRITPALLRKFEAWRDQLAF